MEEAKNPIAEEAKEAEVAKVPILALASQDESIEAVYCPKNHILKCLTEPRAKGWNNCNGGCNRKRIFRCETDPIYRCDECDYDVCKNCRAQILGNNEM